MIFKGSTPEFLPKLWGGERIKKWFKNPCAPAQTGEAWVLSSLCEHTSYIMEKEKKVSLPEFAPDLALLVKLLDANRILSLQVHPNNEQALHYENEKNGKAELWYILEGPDDIASAKEESGIFCGLRPGINPEDLKKAIGNGKGREIKRIQDFLCRFQVKKGDCFYVPPGCIHAIGTGVFMVEVEQPSKLTYRLYDWERIGNDGKARALHHEKGWACFNPDAHPRLIPSNNASPLSLSFSSPFFNILLWDSDTSFSIPSPPKNSCLFIVEGKGKLSKDTFQKGDCFITRDQKSEIHIQLEEKSIILQCG